MLWVADDGSTDATVAIAEERAARTLSLPERRGKGEAATAAAGAALGLLAEEGAKERAKEGAVDGALVGSLDGALVVLCDGDLGSSAARLQALAPALRDGEAHIAVATFAQRRGGGLGIVVGFAKRLLRRRTGMALAAPLSGQRAMRASVLEELLPFAHGFGMEVAMAIDAGRCGFTIAELELELEHRVTGLTLRGALHRARQLLDVARVAVGRR